VGGELPGIRILGRRYLNQPKHFSEVHTEAKILEAGR
jgi:hypothetical protein